MFFANKFFWIPLLLLISLLVSAIWGLMVGAVSISPNIVINSLLQLEGIKQDFIILNLRLPRVLLSILIGASLAASGTIIQAIIQNPLASPKIIGINSGAAFFACLMLVIFPSVSLAYLPIAACVGGLFAATIVLIFAQKISYNSNKLALIGIAIAFCFDAGVDYFLVMVPTHQLSNPLIWLTGSFWGRNWQHLNLISLPLMLTLVISLLCFHRLDLLRLGNVMALNLGVNVSIEKLVLLILATILASLSVSIAGVVGFVGLMAPHMARYLLDASHKASLPTSMLIGALLVTLADALGRYIAPPIEISAGVITALIGAPFFILIMLKSNGKI